MNKKVMVGMLRRRIKSEDLGVDGKVI